MYASKGLKYLLVIQLGHSYNRSKIFQIHILKCFRVKYYKEDNNILFQTVEGPNTKLVDVIFGNPPTVSFLANCMKVKCR